MKATIEEADILEAVKRLRDAAPGTTIVFLVHVLGETTVQTAMRIFWSSNRN